MGKLQVFEIRFDHPQAVYNAGETMRGEVVVQLGEPMKMRNIRCWLYGRGKVHWTRTTGSSKNRRTIHYRAEENYFDHTLLLFGTRENDGLMHPQGVHSYPFEFFLNSALPSSFEGQHGYVRYLCKATIDKPWKFDHDTKAAFTVLSILDLNSEPAELRTAMQGEDGSEVSCCCCVSGNIRAMFRIDRRGYVPGESIKIYAEIHNGSNSTVNNTRVALKQYTEFYGVSDSLFSSGTPKPKCESQFVAELQRGEIAEGKSDIWECLPLRIPPVPPSRLVGCRIINISYVVKFYVSVNYGDDIKLASDVIIGTVPLQDIYAAAYGAVTQQPLPSAPLPGTSVPSAPSLQGAAGPAPPAYDAAGIAPPSYEEYVGGRVHIGDEGDTEHTRGQLQWAPVYPTYSFPPPALADGSTSPQQQP